MKKIIPTIAILTIMATQAQAATITVTSGSDDYTDNSTCSLREAITNANNNANTFDECVPDGDYGTDTITLQDGVTYSLSLSAAANEDNNVTGDLDISSSLTITSDGTATIDAADLTSAGYPERIFNFAGSGSITATLQNLKITNGKIKIPSTLNDGGSAIYLGKSSMTLNVENCEFTDNTAVISGSGALKGGVIGGSSSIKYASLNIEDSSFTNNSVSISGGSGEIEGGLIYLNAFESLSFSNTKFTNNNVAGYKQISGGLIYAAGDTGSIVDSSVTIDESEFSTNTVSTSTSGKTFLGGIFRFSTADVTITNSLFESNAISATDSAVGGILNATSSSSSNTLTIQNSTWYGNTFVSGSNKSVNSTNYVDLYDTVKISYSTFANNKVGSSIASQASGGAFQFVNVNNGEFKANIFKDNTLESNSTSTQYGPVCYAYSSTYGKIISDGYNFIDDASNCLFMTSTDSSDDPTLYSALGNYGGSTDVLVPQSTSPALDFDPTCTGTDGNPVETDQRGAPRDDGNCDSGAYEKGTFYVDSDEDGYGESADEGGVVYYDPVATNNTDCDDTNANKNPGMSEICDGLDNDCDGSVDEDFADIIGESCSVGEGACQTTGHYICGSTPGEYECEADTTISPTSELCDGIDNDCDGETDEDFSNLGSSCTDGVGACESSGVYVCSADLSTTTCNASAGSASAEDCSDGIDNDCDALTDASDDDCTVTGDDDDDDDSSGGGGGGGSSGGKTDTTPQPTNTGDDDDAPGTDPTGDDDDDGNAATGGGGCQLSDSGADSLAAPLAFAAALTTLAVTRRRRNLMGRL